MRGGQTRQAQLAAQLGLALDQGHFVSRARGLDGGGGAGRSGSDDEQSPGVAGGVGDGVVVGLAQGQLPSGARVDGAADRHAGVVMADAGLVTADALDHLVGLAGDGLGHEIGVGDEGPGEADEVRDAVV